MLKGERVSNFFLTKNCNVPIWLQFCEVLEIPKAKCQMSFLDPGYVGMVAKKMLPPPFHHTHLMPERQGVDVSRAGI